MKIPRRVTKIVRGLGKKTCEKRLKELEWLCQEKRRPRGI